MSRHTTLRLPLLALLLLVALLLTPGCKGKREAIIDDNAELLRLAKAALAERHFQQAKARLADIGLINPIPPKMDPDIKLALADAYFYEYSAIDAVEAQSRYEQFVSFYPLHEKTPYARYQVGVCLFKQSESPGNDQEYTVRARDHFRTLATSLEPGNPWRRASQAMVIKAEDRLAAHEWEIAKFYVDKERHLGAIRRLNRLVDSYRGSRYREAAFIELTRAHLAVGDVEQARLSLERLEADYPDATRHEELAQLRAQVAAALGQTPVEGSAG